MIDYTLTLNLNEYLEPLHLAPTQFCELPGFFRKTGFVRSHPLSLINHIFILLVISK